ncbi:MAG TPA: sulfur oxidation c-type cytochrome SoxX [Stellaceae bacterium]|nr:sulfur oxidation c-type cytochrome SoxX [Stellaceae bacterium]
MTRAAKPRTARRAAASVIAAGLLGAGVAMLLAPALRAQSAASGQALAFDRAKGNCLACHTMKGGDVPSNVGPELADMKLRFPDRSTLYAIIDDEEKRNPETVMPPFGKNLILTRQEINAIIDFLYTL